MSQAERLRDSSLYFPSRRRLTVPCLIVHFSGGKRKRSQRTRGKTGERLPRLGQLISLASASCCHRLDSPLTFLTVDPIHLENVRKDTNAGTVPFGGHDHETFFPR